MSADMHRIVAEVARGATRQGRATLMRRVDRLAEAGGGSVPDLQRLLTSAPHPRISGDAAWLLGIVATDAESIARLAAVVQRHPLAEVRYEAVGALGMQGGKLARDVLERALTYDRSMRVRARSANALGLIGERSSLPTLTSVLSDDDEAGTVRGEAAEALGLIGDPSAEEPLLLSLTDPVPEVRFFSAYALGLLNATCAVEELERLARVDDAVADGYGRVSDEAACALADIQRHASKL